MKSKKLKRNMPTTSLKTNLSKFGLCPEDWEIQRTTDNFHLIKNKTEKEFYFLGKSKTILNVESWQFITLLSL